MILHNDYLIVEPLGVITRVNKDYIILSHILEKNI